MGITNSPLSNHPPNVASSNGASLSDGGVTPTRRIISNSKGKNSTTKRKYTLEDSDDENESLILTADSKGKNSTTKRKYSLEDSDDENEYADATLTPRTADDLYID